MTEMNKKHSGARSELLAASWLLEHGYEVFRNVSAHGEIDIIAIKGGELFKFDVKTTDKPENIRLTKRQSELGVWALAVVGGECFIIDNPMIIGVCEELECHGCGKKFQGSGKLRTKGQFNWCSTDCCNRYYYQKSRVG